jgi:cation diffusion facilitator family transporter
MNLFSRLTDTSDRHLAAKISTLVSVVINIIMSTLQVFIGLWANSQALIADGIHSLSDLVSDFVVLIAAHHSRADPDDKHPYGHGRFETAASMVIGLLLLAVGIGMLWSAAQKIQSPALIPTVHPIALGVACLSLVAKEALFRYMLYVAQKIKSSLLIANAWHARSDAASSLVVGVGVIGNMLGYPFLDPLAAMLVGFMIVKMGWSFSYAALNDLMDHGLSAEEVVQLKAVLAATPGVVDVHDLRTRKMGDQAWVDAHLRVDGHISVSEGHFIAVNARRRILALEALPVLDVQVHIDPEDDHESIAPSLLPTREVLLGDIAAVLDDEASYAELHFVLHYLNNRVELDITAPAHASAALLAQLHALPTQLPIIHTLTVKIGVRAG